MDSIQLIKQQILIMKDRGLFEYLDRDADKFLRKLERLNQLLEKPLNNRNFNGAYQVFYRIIDAVPLLVNRNSDTAIYRAVTNEPGELFNHQQRISYNKTRPDKIGKGKYNRPGEAMFYGCMGYPPIPGVPYFSPVETAELEACPELRMPVKTLLLQDFTIGRWLIKRPFWIVNFCFDDGHLLNNPFLARANDVYLNMICEELSLKAAYFVRQMVKVYSRVSATRSDDSAYYMLTALFKAVRDYYRDTYGQLVAGMASPSAATGGKGLNVVLIPEAVDEFLYLDGVIMRRYRLMLPEKIHYDKKECSEEILNWRRVPDFTFEFKEYIPL